MTMLVATFQIGALTEVINRGTYNRSLQGISAEAFMHKMKETNLGVPISAPHFNIPAQIPCHVKKHSHCPCCLKCGYEIAL
jgi:hypothetical protein